MEPTIEERVATLEEEVEGIAHFLMNKAIPIAVVAGAMILFLVGIIVIKQ